MNPIVDREQRFQTICLTILCVIAIAISLYWLRPVMLPFVLAVFFSLILTPLIDVQTKHFKVPRPVALTSTIIIGVIFLSLLALLVTASISEMIANANSYQNNLEQLLNKMLQAINLDQFGVDVQSLVRPLFDTLGSNAGTFIGSTINSMISIMSRGLLVFIFMIFILLGKSKDTRPYNSTWTEAESRIKKYISKKFFISALTGLIVGMILTILHIDMAIVFGLFAFILNFIPSIGSIIATLLPLPVVLVSPEISIVSAILAIALPGAIQFIVGNIIEPKIMGESLDLHPIVILMALIFWGMIWGIVGMLLAAPLTAIMKIMFQKIEFTAPIANLMAGRMDDFKSHT